MPYGEVSWDGGGPGSVGRKVGNNRARLIMTFTDMPGQHAGFIFGVKLSCGGDDERDRAFTHNPFDAPTRWRARVFNRGLVDNPTFADEGADKHGKHAVLVRLQLVRFIDEKNGVSEGTVVINQGQRAAARQVVHEVRADQLQRTCRRE